MGFALGVCAFWVSGGLGWLCGCGEMAYPSVLTLVFFGGMMVAEPIRRFIVTVPPAAKRDSGFDTDDVVAEKSELCMCKEPGAGDWHPNMTCADAAVADLAAGRIEHLNYMLDLAEKNNADLSVQLVAQEDENEELQARLSEMIRVNQQWCDKWDRLSCEWCGTSNAMGDGSDMDGAMYG